MRTIIFSLFVVLLFTQVKAQKIITNPKIGISNEPRLTITKIEIKESETILSFHAKYPKGSGIGIRQKSFIQVVGEKDSLFMTKQDTPAKDETGWIPIPEGGLKYKLHFPPISPSTLKIDFAEPDAKGWKLFDVEINRNSTNSIVPEQLLGNWFSPKTGKWTFSFLEEVAIFDGKVWEYKSALPGENVSEVILQHGNQIKQLNCRADGDDFCFMNTDDITLLRYSKEPNLNQKKYSDETFETPVLAPDMVTYSGVINGFTTRLGSSTGIMRYSNRLSNQQETVLIKVQENGTFSVQFPLDYPQELMVKFPSGSQRVFFEPGKSLFQLINSGLADYSTLNMGESADVNYGLEASKNIATGNMEFLEGIIEMNEEEYIQHVLSVKDKELKQLKELARKHKIGVKATQVRMLDIEFRAAKQALNFNQNIRMATFYANRKLQKDEQIQYVPKSFDLALLENIKNTPVDSELAFLSQQYFVLAQGLKYADFKRPQGGYYYLITELAAELKKQGIEITGEETDMLEFVRLNLLENYIDSEARNFNRSYRKVVQGFTQKHKDLYDSISQNYYSENVKQNCLLTFGDAGNKLVELAEMQQFLGTQAKSDKLMESEFKETKQLLKNDALKEYVIAAYYKKKAEIENASDEVVLKTEGDKLFHSIISKFKGKVVYVDFWATWCGPCKAGIERIKPLKEALKNENIVFVYITNPSSPEKDYQKAIPDIKGEHFKVTADEWNYLTQKFNIYGIPHYALVNSKGKIVQAHMAHLDNDALKKVLMEQVAGDNLK